MPVVHPCVHAHPDNPDPFPPPPTHTGPSNGGDVPATVQSGPIGAAQTYYVSGSLTFSSGGTASKNMFQFTQTGIPSDPAFGQTRPPGGPFGNTGAGGPIDVAIGTGVEFGAQFLSRDFYTLSSPVFTSVHRALEGFDNCVATTAPCSTAPVLSVLVPLQVFANLFDTGDITINTELLIPSGAQIASIPNSFLGTMTLTSSLFVGATSINPVTFPLRLEHVLADSFELKDEQAQPAAAAAAGPLDSTAPVQPLNSVGQAVQPAQQPGSITGVISDQATGKLIFDLKADTWTSASNTASFRVVSGTSPY